METLAPLLLLLLFASASAAPLGRVPRFLGRYARGKPSRVTSPAPYEYDVRYFGQTLDHFSFAELPEFQQKYLVGRDDLWRRNGPIFFYCGNEGDIDWFAENTGFVWEIAPLFGALVVFAEHRYYGKSMPFGSPESAYKDAKSLAYLTTEQALADFATLLTDLKHNLSSEGSPVVLFGGSYGGSKFLNHLSFALGQLSFATDVFSFDESYLLELGRPRPITVAEPDPIPWFTTKPKLVYFCTIETNPISEMEQKIYLLIYVFSLCLLN